MAQERSSTPEKQLLNLIEGPDDKGKNIKTHAIKHQGAGFLSVGAWKSRASFFKDHFKVSFGEVFRRPDIRLINALLFCIVAGLIFYQIYSASFSIAKLSKPIDLKASPRGSKEKSANGEETPVYERSVYYYIAKIAARDIFKIGVKAQAKKKPEDSEEGQSPVAEVLKRFKLVGISWSKDPDAMIEDTQSLKTFFVKRGEALGDVKVEAILRDKVLLSYKGEEAELK